jgi:hypothetical protein
MLRVEPSGGTDETESVIYTKITVELIAKLLPFSKIKKKKKKTSRKKYRSRVGQPCVHIKNS